MARARTLILGGAGFIGLHLARQLANGGREVTIVDDFSRGARDEDMEALLQSGAVELVEADLSRPEDLELVPRDWEATFMLAARVGVRRAMSDPGGVLRTNTLAILNVLDWMRPSCGVFFFASTSEVYAGGVMGRSVPVPTPEDVPVTIDRIANPRFAYAAGKILGEAAVLHCGAGKGLDFVIGRLHNVYGPRMGFEHVVPELCLRAIGREDPYRVYGPEQRRAFCYVDDAVTQILALVASPRARGHVVNVGNDAEEVPAGRLADMILAMADHRPRLESLPAPQGSVDRRCPDLSRLRDLTGVEPVVPLAEGLRRTYDWYLENRDRLPQRVSP